MRVTKEERQREYDRMSIVTLAFIGDGVWDLFIRERCLALVPTATASSGDRLHAEAVKYVKAAAQARAVRTLKDGLGEAEKDLLRRARNRKPKTVPKNAELMDYKWATAFEALIGHLYLAGREGELRGIMERAADIIEKQKEGMGA